MAKFKEKVDTFRKSKKVQRVVAVYLLATLALLLGKNVEIYYNFFRGIPMSSSDCLAVVTVAFIMAIIVVPEKKCKCSKKENTESLKDPA